jgi:hypothetical protein
MIVVRGEMDESMSDWLDGMKVTLSSPAGDPEVTTLVGRLRDQAALRGVVETLYEFHFPILSIERIGD